SHVNCKDGFVLDNDNHPNPTLITSIGCYDSDCACFLHSYNTNVCDSVGKTASCIDVIPTIEYGELPGCVKGMTIECEVGGHLLVKLKASSTVTFYEITSPIIVARCKGMEYSISAGVDFPTPIQLTFEHSIACTTD
ncbi:hypothetical protein PENTCL1PPCAC_2579, partial [Pristionchus entomophagus]